MDGIGFGIWLLPKFAKPRVRQIVLSESQVAELKNYGFVDVQVCQQLGKNPCGTSHTVHVTEHQYTVSCRKNRWAEVSVD